MKYLLDQDRQALARTLHGVLKNLQELVDEEGFEFWESFCVLLVFDGRHKASPSALQFATQLGVFNADILVGTSHERDVPDVSMHLFEFTAQVPFEVMTDSIGGGTKARSERAMDEGQDENCEAMYFPPMQTVVALKEQNGGKLHSHLWGFNALCSQINPAYVVLLDVGTEPHKNAIQVSGLQV
jgi:chitin synthase